MGMLRLVHRRSYTCICENCGKFFENREPPALNVFHFCCSRCYTFFVRTHPPKGKRYGKDTS